MEKNINQIIRGKITFMKYVPKCQHFKTPYLFSFFILFILLNTHVFSQNNPPKVGYTYNIGSDYSSGIVYQLYEDGSGGKLFCYARAATFDEAMKEIESNNEYGIRLYMADDYELQKLFKLDVTGPSWHIGSKNSLWFLGKRRMINYNKPMAYSHESILSLPEKSTERVAELARYGSIEERWSDKCLYAVFGIFSLQK